MFGSLKNLKALNGEMNMGAQASIMGRFGVRWDTSNGWQTIQDRGWNFTYFLPEWEFESNDSQLRAYVSPEVVASVWSIVPVAVKPKPYVGVDFGPKPSRRVLEDGSQTFA